MSLKVKSPRDTAPLQVTSTMAARMSAQRVEEAGDVEIVRGAVCQIGSGGLIPGFNPSVSGVPYFAETNSGSFKRDLAEGDEYLGMHDTAVVTVLRADAPIAFQLTAINFADGVDAEDFSVDDFLVPHCTVSGSTFLVTYPVAGTDAEAGRVMAAPAASTVKTGTSIPVVAQVIKVGADFIEVRPMDGSRVIAGTHA